jgi:transposase
MRQMHPAGERMFVDYAGQTVELVDGRTGEISRAQVSVAVIGASSYLYAEASWTQTLPDWIGLHVRALAFMSGVSAQLVPDNPKVGVDRANWSSQGSIIPISSWRPIMAAILPTRPRKPRGKAKVEVGLLVVERWVLARPGIDREQLGRHLHAWLQVAVADGGVLCVADDDSVTSKVDPPLD